MQRDPTTTPEPMPLTAQPRRGNHAEHSRANAALEGLGEQGGSETVIDHGGQIVQAEGNDLGRASSGELRYADEDSAQQRMRDCQSALVSLGYHLGHTDDPADGITGEFEATTREATTQFQDDNHLEVTGRIDRETYEALMRSFEQAMSMRSHGELDDGFTFVQGEQAIGEAPQDADDLAAVPSNFADGETLLELQEELDAGTPPPELEDL